MEATTTNNMGTEIKETYYDDMPSDTITSGVTTPVDDDIPTVDAELVNSDVLNEADFINDDNEDAFKFMNLKTRLDDIKKLSNDILSERNKFIDEDEDSYEIDKILESVDTETIKNMSQEDFDKTFVIDGEPFNVNIDFDNPNDALNFKKDFLIFRKETLKTSKELEEEMNKINAEIEASKDEFEAIMNEYKNMTNLIRKSIIKKIESAESDEKKILYTDILTQFDDSLTLTGFKNYLRSYKGKRILADYTFDKNSMSIYRRYKKVNDKLKIKDDLKNFSNLEKTYLGDEYAKRPNIILFSLMHFIASKNNQENIATFGVFITQFIVNLKNLIFDKFDSESDKEIFVASLKEVVDIIG